MKLEKILKKSLNIKQNEKVLIVTDKRKLKIAKKFFNSCKKLSKKVKILIKPIAKQTAEEPPKYVAGEMKNSNVVLVITSLSSMTHTKARINASEKGARIATMPDFIPKMFKALWIDPSRISKSCKKVKRLLSKVESVRIVTNSGSNLQFSIKNRLILVDDGVYHKKGKFGNLPAGEVCLAPVERTTNGILVIDSLKDLNIIYAKPKTKVFIKNGKVIDISDKSCKLAKIFKKIKNSTNIAEFGIGTNYKAKVIGAILQDEKAIRTCHIAFGNNKSFNGKVYSKVHLDAILFKPTIWFDDKIIMRNGKLLI